MIKGKKLITKAHTQCGIYRKLKDYANNKIP